MVKRENLESGLPGLSLNHHVIFSMLFDLSGSRLGSLICKLGYGVPAILGLL